MEFALIALITAVPFAFLVGLLRSSLSRAGTVSGLVERFGTTTVRDALAEALGDPDLTLAYWLPRPRRYVDADGRPAEFPAGRAVTEIEHDGARIAAIVHDETLLEEPELVRAAGAAAALALHNERLDAELRARYEELRASAPGWSRPATPRAARSSATSTTAPSSTSSRSRSRCAWPAPARETDSKAAALLDDAIDELKEGLAELRELARGIHPAVLTERGLEPALAGLAARATVPVSVSADVDGRLEPELESAAYFVVCEALTNVAKYAGATCAEVSIEQVNGHVVIAVRDDGIGGADASSGTGLRGIADRVAALDGRLDVDSPPGGGTFVRAELPTAAGHPTPAR